MWRFRRLEAVNRWLTRAPTTLEDFRAHSADPASLAKTLVIERDGEVIGDLMLAVDDAWSQAEVADRARGVQARLGWALDPGHAGHGYAAEAVRELLHICFDDLGLHRVIAECFAANEASWRLMERVGMRRETHTVRDSLHRSGAWLDGYGYALLADEWAP
jgi:RimJ/RimL family protein N-acetyltransferase